MVFAPQCDGADLNHVFRLANVYDVLQLSLLTTHVCVRRVCGVCVSVHV